MRDTKEILERIESIGFDLFGAKKTHLIDALTFDQARPYLNEEWVAKVEAGDETWEQLKNDEDVKADMLDYMPFAWEKANNRRGLSAARSLDHMSGWLWLLGFDPDFVEDYGFYGKDKLRAICEHFGWDWTQWDDGEWTNEECGPAAGPPKDVTPLAA